MLTILRFRNFRIVIYTHDHAPAHIHALGPGVQSTYFLNCPAGPIARRTQTEERALIRFLSDSSV